MALLMLVTGGLAWANKSETDCWKNEVDSALQKYGGLGDRKKILQAADVEKDPGTAVVEVIETDPNGCSLGSNGQTVVRFYFSKANKLTEIRVYKNYIAANYKMELIGKREFKQ